MFLKTLKPSFKILTALALSAIGISLQPAQAAFGPGTLHSVTLAWNAVPETNITGYKVHVGTVPGEYTQTHDAGMDLSYSVEGLEYGTTYYFSVKTVADTGHESDYSPELTLTVSLPPLPAAAAMSSGPSGSTGLQWSYPKNALDSYPDFIIESSTDLITWTPSGTVSSDAASGSTTTHMTYSWAVTKNGPQRFYRMTARNWLGDSMNP